MGYSHLTATERGSILCLRAQGYGIRKISRALNRSSSTISRELQRNLVKGAYSAHEAGKLYRLRRKRCRLRLPDGNVLQLSEERERVLRDKGYRGKEVVAGIRPESLHESQVDPLTKRFSRIRATVEVAELMGSETLLYSTLFGRQIVARVVHDTEKTVGDEAEFHVHWKRIHVFDKETELNVMRDPQAPDLSSNKC